MIITTANISTSFHGSHCNFLTSLHGRPQIFKQFFTAVIWNVLTIRENRIIWRSKYCQSDLRRERRRVGCLVSCSALQCVAAHSSRCITSHVRRNVCCSALQCIVVGVAFVSQRVLHLFRSDYVFMFDVCARALHLTSSVMSCMCVACVLHMCYMYVARVLHVRCSDYVLMFDVKAKHH